MRPMFDAIPRGSSFFQEYTEVSEEKTKSMKTYDSHMVRSLKTYGRGDEKNRRHHAIMWDFLQNTWKRRHEKKARVNSGTRPGPRPQVRPNLAAILG